MLFCHYIDDLVLELLKISKYVYAYADDLAILTEDKRYFENAIMTINKWCQGNYMKIN
jgi:hypothetical protein